MNTLHLYHNVWEGILAYFIFRDELLDNPEYIWNSHDGVKCFLLTNISSVWSHHRSGEQVSLSSSTN